MKYQDAITTVFSKRESKNENSGSIPQELLKIHPKEIILEMPNIYAEADKIQQAVLADIIFKANESVYGKKYNFSQIKSLAQAIIDDIKVGIGRTDGKYVEICDRKEAIRYAIAHGQPGDVIVLAGKGHEDYQEIKGVKYPMDERVLIAEVLEELKAEKQE